MITAKHRVQFFGTLAAAAMLLVARAALPAPENTVRLGADDIGGTVTSSRGPEAGVWVIAETHDFQTRFAKIVVTDEAGRYLIPDLPQAKYRVWVRGYGLADSPAVDAALGRPLDLAALVAADAATAAKIYPAAYWYAMMRIPEEAEVANVAGGRNGYLMWMKNMGCVGCHQLGNLATRTIPKSLGPYKSSQEAWARRLQSGQAGRTDDQHRARRRWRAFRFAIWPIGPTVSPPANCPRVRPRVRAASSATSSRPCATGRTARRICMTSRERIAAIPRVNANGLLYGAPELSSDDFPVLDPAHNRATTFRRVRCVTPIRRPPTMTRCWGPRPIGARSGSGTAGRMPTIRCRIVPGASGTPREFARPTILHSAKKARLIRPPRRFRSTRRSGSSRCMSRRAANTLTSTPASARITCNSPKMRTTRCGPAAATRSWAGSTPRNSIRPAMRRLLRVGLPWCSTPTVTASSIRGWNLVNRRIPSETSVWPSAFTPSCRIPPTAASGARSRFVIPAPSFASTRAAA